MRKVAYALVAFCALTFSAQTSASAGCYGECNGYREGRPVYDRDYDRGYDRSAYRSYREPCCSERSSYDDDGPRYHTTYYVRGPEYQTGYREYGYDDGYRRSYYDRPYYRSSYGYGYDRGYGYGYRGYDYAPTVRYGGGWSQTAYGYGSGYGYGGCHTAYIPYGWTWYRAHSC